MVKFISSVDQQFEDVFILNAEASCYFCDQFFQSFPYSFRYTEFFAFANSIFKQATDSSIVGKPLGSGEYVVLHGSNSCACNLRGEVAHLIFAKTEILFALLEYDFQRPAHGVYPVGFEEGKRGVGGYQGAPLCVFVSLVEEEAHVVVGKFDVHHNIVASQSSAVLTSFLRMVELSNQRIGCVFLTIVCVLGLAHLCHTQIMALHVARADKADDFSASKPAVSQNVVELHATLDTLNHLYHQGNLASIILIYAFLDRTILVMLLTEAVVQLILSETILTGLALLADKGIVKQHLTLAVCDTKEQGLETSVIL